MTQTDKKINNREQNKNWTFIVYPESVAPNWIDYLTNDLKLCWVCSPLHDKDLNSDGTFKKPHYHCIILFETKKTYLKVKSLTDSIGATSPQVVLNLRGNVRYLTHLDNKTKAQYLTDDISCFNGFDVNEFLTDKKENSEMSLQTRLKAVREMIEFIKTNGLTEFTQIFEYASENNSVWFESLCCNSAYVIDTYLKSKRYQLKK